MKYLTNIAELFKFDIRFDNFVFEKEIKKTIN